MDLAIPVVTEAGFAEVAKGLFPLALIASRSLASLSQFPHLENGNFLNYLVDRVTLWT